MKKFNKFSVVVLAVAFALGQVGISAAATHVDLGTASSFAILAGTTVTNTGPSEITGDLGLSPGSSVTGFPPGTLNGTEHISDPTAVQAKSDLVTAYNDAAGQTPVVTVPTELGGTTKTPGVYDSAAGTFGITGTLTLDGQGDPNAVFIFKTASTLITADSSNVVLINGAQACNVFWQVGSSATLGTDSIFRGNILALTSITATTGAVIEGSLLARNGAVTLDSNTVTVSVCAASAPTPTPPGPGEGGPGEGGPGTGEGERPGIGEGARPGTGEGERPGTGEDAVYPGLPKTGFAPEEKGFQWNTVILVGILTGSVLFKAARRRKII